jgi:hypothetical protein
MSYHENASLRAAARDRRWYSLTGSQHRMSLVGVRWIDLPHMQDDRGILTAIEAGLNVPFEIRRVFFLHGVRASRGGHAHRSSRQFLVPASGTFRVEVSDRVNSSSFELTNPHRGLYVPPMHWVHLDSFSTGAVCLVLTDTPFDAAEYLRDWTEFLELSRVSENGS